MYACVLPPCWLRAVLTTALVLGLIVADTAVGQEDEQSTAAMPKASNVSGEEQERLRSESIELEKAGKIAEAIAATEQVLAIELQLLGRDSLELAETYERLAQLHVMADSLNAAELAADESHRLKKQHLGDGHWQVTDARWTARDIKQRGELSLAELRELDTADATVTRAMELVATRRYADAMAVLKNMPPVYQRILGEVHPKHGHSLFVLAHTHAFQGDYTLATPLYERAREIQRAALGEDHPGYANNLSSLAFAYQMQRDFMRAEPLYQQALVIKNKWLGAEHADFLMSLEVLAQLYQSTGRHAEARPLLEQVVATRKKTLGDKHLLYARGINNVAQTYQALGDYRRAEQHFLEAMAILRPIVGERHADYGAVVNNLATLYQYTREYARAAPLSEQALQIFREAFGEKHPKYAAGLHNLGYLYRLMGDHARAESLFTEAIQIYKQSLGNQHPEYATALHSLAELYHVTEQYDRARRFYLEALQIRIDTGNTEGVGYAINVNDLALLYHTTGELDRAEELFVEALEITKRAVGEQHREYAVALGNLAALYQAQGEFDRALPLCQEAITALKNSLGEGHVDYAVSLNRLSWLHAVQGDYVQALELAENADRIQRANLQKVLAGASEHTMRTFLATQRDAASWLISLAQKTPDTPHAASAAYRAALGRKTAVFDAMLRLRQFERLAAGDSAIAAQSLRLRELRQKVANSALSPAGSSPAEDRRKDLLEIDALETQLNRELQKALGPSRALNLDTFDLDSLATKLPADAALIELVQYTPFNFQATDQDQLWQGTRYVAFILRTGEQAEVDLVDLGPAEAIDRLVDELRAHVVGTPRAVALSSEEELEAEYRDIAEPLSQLVVAPLLAKIGGQARLFIAPDGEMARIPWEALLDDQDRYLVETRSLSYLSSGTDLLRESIPLGKGTVVFAAPDYQLDGQRAAPSPQLIAQLRGKSHDVFAGDVSIDVRGLNWDALPATLQEAEQIQDLLNGHPELGPVTKLLGATALEGALKQMRAPRLLHLATHGYYLPNQKTTQATGAEAFTLDSSGRVSAARGLAALGRLENPLLRSGLVLAGANRRRDESASDVPSEAVDDGWVTAEEIGLLDLAGTELVVLSACETGLGDLRTGEGVSGLRRAFVHAGVRTLVTSLYKVPDTATQELMTEFYTRISDNQSKQAALSAAERTIIAKRRQEQGGAHPFFWSSFILVGDPD